AVMALVVAPHPLARGEPPDGRPDGLDDPGHVPPYDEREGQVLRQLAAADQGVHRIDANRRGLDEHVGRADRWRWQLAEPDGLGRADAVDVSRFHRAALWGPPFRSARPNRGLSNRLTRRRGRGTTDSLAVPVPLVCSIDSGADLSPPFHHAEASPRTGR